MFHPINTYRFQFHKGFNFESFQKIIPYLVKLGVHTIYASPIFTSSPGSTHGYDGLDPHQINPEIGTLAQFEAISDQLKTHNIQWLQDIVPNHMSYHPENSWLMDVMEKGPLSIYADYFDTALSSQLFKGRIMAPFLGEEPSELLPKGDIRIRRQEDRFFLNYNEIAYPLCAISYKTIFLLAGMDLPPELDKLVRHLPLSLNAKEYNKDWESWRAQFALLLGNGKIKKFVDQCVQRINNNAVQLSGILEEQHYRLCKWIESDDHINYRRFFIVNSLICLNIQNPEVFDNYHCFIRKLAVEGRFHGLRIDHIDGLYNPDQYLQRLREMCGEEIYIVVEKILEAGEPFPRHWPVEGNTGYDFLSLVNNIQTNRSNEELFTRFYQKMVKDDTPPGEQIIEKKSAILYQHMRGELENLSRLFETLQLGEREELEKVGSANIKEAIGAFLIHCPVYRYYITKLPLKTDEEKAIREILGKVEKSNPLLRNAVAILADVFITRPAKEGANNDAALLFLQRCMQFTGPLMAKGVEDTLMYTYNRFIGHNEVGDSPEAFGISKEDFHHHMTERQLYWPLSLNATSTHDTKRGEDVRARLNVLTDLGEEWIKNVKDWQLLNAGYKKEGFPDANDEYFIYQTMVGAYPMPGEEEDDFGKRLQDYLQKALRESKRNSNWGQPNIIYENATRDFIEKILDKEQPFFNHFKAFLDRIANPGVVHSIVQVILKFTLPGVPDTYQGCELWDLSLVDPDNRRPVDYEKREKLLEEISPINGSSLVSTLWKKKFNPAIKLWITNRLMQWRSENPDLLQDGNYIPLKTEGKYKEYILAFARRRREEACVIIVPLHIASLCKEQDREPENIDWKDTAVILPAESEEEWVNVLIERKEQYHGKIPIHTAFKDCSFALLCGRYKENNRNAGILLHITSLPSPYGCGDLGKEARSFARFLNKGRQKFWQTLPVNPTGEGQGFSPYSSFSSMAGNPVLISPEELMHDGLLLEEELKNAKIPYTGKVDFPYAEAIRKELFDKAWQRFKESSFPDLQNELDEFKQKESYWLDDFSYYMVLKQMHGGKTWHEWEEKYKYYNRDILKKLAIEKADEIEKVKWVQAIFNRQWKELLNYCHQLGIELIGDIPFYVSYDSADVWSQPQYFALDKKGEILYQAGVPPDLFSEDGQLWGMPVFNWKALKQDEYLWWINRLKRNGKMFDLLRLDHFRAFSSFWQVPASDTNAIKGVWGEGPGADFFETVGKIFEPLPFIAEDLGEIDQPVYDLRDQFHLPGMKVLQFAFGDELPFSPHIPHNFQTKFVVYTGTHDNNTTRGWYRLEKDIVHPHLYSYLNKDITEQTIAEDMMRLAFSSVAETVILPLQDLLNLDENARMNIPSSNKNNWTWQLKPGEIKGAEKLRYWVALYNRE